MSLKETSPNPVICDADYVSKIFLSILLTFLLYIIILSEDFCEWCISLEAWKNGGFQTPPSGKAESWLAL